MLATSSIFRSLALIFKRRLLNAHLVFVCVYLSASHILFLIFRFPLFRDSLCSLLLSPSVIIKSTPILIFWSCVCISWWNWGRWVLECYCVCATVELVSSVFTKVSLHELQPTLMMVNTKTACLIVPFESLCFPVLFFSFSVSTPSSFSTLFVSNSIYVPFLHI